MMRLGLVLHSAVSDTTCPLGAAWPDQDPHTSPWGDLVAFFIRLFRMPVCFIVAGCFGALPYARDGAGGLARHWLRRVLAPVRRGVGRAVPAHRVGLRVRARPGVGG